MCGGTWRELRALFLIKPTIVESVCYRKQVVYLYVGMRICVYAAMSFLRVFTRLCGYLDMCACIYADMRICCFWVLTFAYVDLAICINDGRVLFL